MNIFSKVINIYRGNRYQKAYERGFLAGIHHSVCRQWFCTKDYYTCPQVKAYHEKIDSEKGKRYE